ncbi:AMP-dependent synthetase/ligase [Flavisolibacter nicotianae]|uniref:AMP-dependent synthetase/ligase n=1 Tax=Flavisolibacter nicotianae TaxID=2364882 RepID=UPI000EAEEFCC|nr:long-chain fatty acid--CoA ligase [Flavisolibacter nicotianae]
MNKPHRLFDCLELQREKGGVEGALVAKEGGRWRKYSTREVKDIVDRLSAGLIALGIGCGDMSVEGRDKIAILSKNRPEWVFLDLAVQQIGAVLVPIYPTAHANDISFIMNDAAVKMLFFNDADLTEKVQQMIATVPSLKEIVSFERTEGFRHWQELLSLGTQEHFLKIEEASARINTEDLFTIIYTSGTTGSPKGVMLSHHNVLSNVMSTLPDFPLTLNTRVLSFLPLNHIFERMVTYIFLFAGASIHYAESLDTLGENFKEVKPEMFTTVPRLLEKVFEKIMAKGNEQKGIKHKLFFWALRLGEKYDIQEKGSAGYRLQLALARKIVFKKWREALGDEVKCIVTGAAACPVKLIRLFSAAGIPILEGYGQTESSPVISVNQLNEANWMIGTVGPVISGVNVKIAEDGEILCKGPNVMMGYYKRPDLTAETVIDGWLHTGDIGTLVNDKFLKITDRKKEIFKTSGGKYVAPQPIENKLAESPFIEQVMIVGAGEKFTGALIVPSQKALGDWCRQRGIDVNGASHGLLHHPQVHHHFQQIINEANRHFNKVEQVKKFELLPTEWSIEGGELTPTLKLKRKVIMEKYNDIVRRIYT